MVKGKGMGRITEKRILSIPKTPTISDGTNRGMLQVDDSSAWMVGQIVLLSSDTQGPIELKIKRIDSDGKTMYLGAVDTRIDERSDISMYLVADTATLQANEQKRPSIPEQEIERITYEEEPALARRTIMVDKLGNRVDKANPFPVIISDGEDTIELNPDGSISTVGSGLSRFVDVVNNITYEGYAAVGSLPSDPAWRISRTVKQSDGDSITLMAGTGTYDQVWDNRELLFPAETPINFFNRDYEKLLPLLANKNWLNLANFDRVTPVFEENRVTLEYYDTDVLLAKLFVTFNHDLSWEMQSERYAVGDNGTPLTMDDGTPFLLDD